MSVSKPCCCGIIVFDQDQTILVNTHNGNFSFPKGGKKKQETYLEAAWRELEEETGLTMNNVKLIDDFHIDENSSRGNIAIRYFVGYIIKSAQRISFDPNELAGVTWFNIEDALALDKFKTVRKDILTKAHKEFIRYTL